MPPPDRRKRRYVAVATIVALIFGGFAFASWLVYRGNARPLRFTERSPEAAWVIAPDAQSLTQAAVDRIEGGLSALNDRTLAPRQRLGTYRSELEAAATLLERSLRAQPAQAEALAKLAVVRWELAPSGNDQDAEPILNMLALAATMAPTVPTVQTRIGELLLRMGKRDDAFEYLARAVELNGDGSADIVELLRKQLVPATEIAARLPPDPRVLVALRTPYFEDSLGLEYVDSVERALAESDPPSMELLFAFGGACLDLGVPDRLLSGIEGIGSLDDPRLEANRLRQRSRAWAALGDHVTAVVDAEDAHRLDPTDPSLTELLGDQLHGAGRFEQANQMHRAALRQLARGAANPAIRSRIYRKIGQSCEARGETAEAYDAYRMALELDPQEPVARARITWMRGAAGLAPDDAP